MQEIDINKWDRKEHFIFFHRLDYPQFNISFNLDITGFLPYIKERNYSFYYAMIFYVSQAANKITEFRYRIRNEKVFLHSTTHPSFTDMQKGQTLFKILTVELPDNLEDFIRNSQTQALEQKEYFPSSTQGARDDVIYITCIPWISFTQLSHSIHLNKDNSIPRISWGKYFQEKKRILLPFSVQLNHSLADGYHVGLFKDLLEQEINSFKLF